MVGDAKMIFTLIFELVIWSQLQLSLPLASHTALEKKKIFHFTKIHLFFPDSKISLTSNYCYIEGFGDVK